MEELEEAHHLSEECLIYACLPKKVEYLEFRCEKVRPIAMGGLKEGLLKGRPVGT